MSPVRPYESVFRWKKGIAALTSALTAFCLLIFLTSLSVREIESSATVDVALPDGGVEEHVQQLIATELSERQLMRHLQATTDRCRTIVNDHIGQHDVDAVKNALKIRFAKQNGANGDYRLTTAYLGRGTQGERLLVDEIVHALVSRMRAASSAARAFQEINRHLAGLGEESMTNVSARQAELNSAMDQLEQLNGTLSDLHEQVESVAADRSDSAFDNGNDTPLEAETRDMLTQALQDLRQGLQELDTGAYHAAYGRLQRATAGLDESLSPLLEEETTFQVASNREGAPMRVVNASLRSGGPLRQVLDAIDEIDVDAVKSKVMQAQQNLRSDDRQFQDRLARLESAARTLSNGHVMVGAVSPARSRPVGDRPDSITLLLFTGLAIAFGAVVAFGYKPELVDIGFESSADAARRIGLPLISTIAADQVVEGSAGSRRSIINSMVRVCEIGLTGFVLLAVVLCLTVPEIRAAFIENPVYGLSRIGDLFWGP